MFGPLDFPFRLDSRGRAAETDTDDHIRDLIVQVLFTNPGERVNRPDFGCGLLQLVFMPNSDALATATQFTVQGALQRWLDDLIAIKDAEIATVTDHSDDNGSPCRVHVIQWVWQVQSFELAHNLTPGA